MGLTDFLLGKSSLQSQRDRAQQFAREQYDPSVFDPIRNQAARQATEGVGDAGDIARARTVQSLFSPASTNVFSGNQARALAQQQQMTGQRQQALAGFEGQLAQTDIQMRQQGQQQAAQGEAQALQMQARQDAAIEETQLQYEAELDRRKQALGGAAFGLLGTALTTPFGEEGTTIAGNLLGGLFGEDAPDGTISLADAARKGVESAGHVVDTDQALSQAEAGIESLLGDTPDFSQRLSTPQTSSGGIGPNPWMDYDRSLDDVPAVENTFSAANFTDDMRDYLTTNEGQMQTFGIDRPEMQNQIQQLFGGGEQPTEEELSRAEAEQIFQSPEFQTEYYSSLARGGPIDRGVTDALSSLLIGYNTEGQRTNLHSISDIFQSPFIMAGRGFNMFKSAIDERNERLKEEALQRIMQGQR